MYNPVHTDILKTELNCRFFFSFWESKLKTDKKELGTRSKTKKEIKKIGEVRSCWVCDMNELKSERQELRKSLSKPPKKTKEVKSKKKKTRLEY